MTVLNQALTLGQLYVPIQIIQNSLIIFEASQYPYLYILFNGALRKTLKNMLFKRWNKTAATPVVFASSSLN
uniref:Uncharacterized protein n=1 Tax=Acrobeloides nanus TaxID=290746 RepID=A0A914D4S2_9BILA